MATNPSVFPMEHTHDARDDEPKTVGLFTEEADRMLDVLGSDTARTLLLELCEEHAAKSDLAERVDTSLQNAHYHLDRLEEAGLVEVVGTRYSTRGVEMDVYAPASDPLVLVGGDAEERETVDDRLSGDRPPETPSPRA